MRNAQSKLLSIRGSDSKPLNATLNRTACFSLSQLCPNLPLHDWLTHRLSAALAHNSFPLDYSDNEFLSQERPFQPHLPPNDYLHPGYPRATPRNHSSTPSVALPINSAIKYRAHPSLHDSS